MSESAGVRQTADYMGVVGISGQHSTGADIGVDVCTAPKQLKLRVQGGWGLVCSSESGVAVSRKEDVFVALRGDCFIASGDEHSEWQPASARTILAAYMAGQLEGPQQLFGHFSVAIVDGRSQCCTLAVDRYGVHSLFYAVEDGVFYFAGNLQQLIRSMDPSPRVCVQAIYEYVYFRVVPGPNTFFSGVRRVQPGQEVVFSNNTVKTRAYWNARYAPRESRSPEARNKELLDLLERSVRLRLATDGPTGAFLSGGIDSSTISGILSRQTSGDTYTYSIGFDAPGYDEMEYARLVAKHFGTKHNEYYVTPGDVVEAVPKIVGIQEQPFGKESLVPAYYCADMARADGVRRLLAGDGGDELFGGNAHYARQQLFSVYEHVPAPIRRVLEPVFLGPHRLPLTSKARSYLEQARVPLPRRLEFYNLLVRTGPRAVFADEILDQVDTHRPLAMLEEAYFEPDTDDAVNKMLALDLRFILADGDLPKVNMACQLAGVDVAFPMLDDRIVAFAGTIPPHEKFRYPKLRIFYKQAMHGFLPKQTLSKKKQGFGLPFGCWLQSDAALRELVGDSFAQLAKRNIFRREFLDDLSSRKHAEHAAYYGEMIWILMILEQWLSAKRLSLPV